MAYSCCAMGRCLWCNNEKECHRRYARPLGSNEKFLSGRAVAEYFEDMNKAMIAEIKKTSPILGFVKMTETAAGPEPQSISIHPRPKPKVASLWNPMTYWRLIRLAIAIIRAVKKAREHAERNNAKAS